MTPAIDLATLSVADLRRLLDRAEARGQVALAEQIRLTLAERAQGGQAARPRRGGNEETPELRLPADLSEPEAPAAAKTPDADAEAEADDAWVLTISTDRRRAPKARRRRTASRLLAGVACLAAAAAAWALSGLTPPWRPQPKAPAPAPRAMEAHVAAPPPVLEPPPATEETAAQLPPQLRPEDIQSAAAEPAPAPAAEPEPAPERQAAADPCGALPTAAERMVCADPGLKAQHRQLQEAYIRALNSRADPKALDAGQAAFRLAVSRAETPERLAELYDRRIRELNAATAEARLRLNAY